MARDSAIDWKDVPESGRDDSDDDPKVGPLAPADTPTLPGVADPSGPAVPLPTEEKANPAATALQQKLLQQFEQSANRSAELFKQKREAVAPLQDKMMETLAEPTPQPPELRTPSAQAPNLPEMGKQANEWFIAATSIAILGTARTRLAAQNGLTAMAGIADGIREGNQDKFKAEMERWKESNSAIIEWNKAMTSQYKQVMENKKLDLDQKAQMLALVASKFDDQLGYEQLMRRQYIDFGKLVQNTELQTQKMVVAQAQAERALAQAELARNKAQQAQNANTENAADLAEAYRQGGPEALRLRLGRAGANDAMRDAINSEIKKQMKENNETYADLRVRWAEQKGLDSAERALFNRVAQFSLAQNEYRQMRPVLTEVMSSVTRLGPRVGNVAIRKAALETGSVQEVQLSTAIQTLAKVYARATNLAPPTVYSIQDAYRIINENMTVNQMKGILDIMDKEIGAAGASPEAARDELRRMFGRSHAKPAVNPTLTEPTETKKIGDKTFRKIDGKWFEE